MEQNLMLGSKNLLADQVDVISIFKVLVEFDDVWVILYK